MRIRQAVLVVLGITGIGAGVLASRQWFDHRLAAAAAQSEQGQRMVAWRIATPRMEIAHEEALKAVDARAQQVADFFAERKKRVPAYAERVLSFRSKWELSWSKMPFTDKETHARFLREEFGRLVFSEAELSHAVTGAIEDDVRDLHAIENTLLVKIRADLKDLPECVAVLPDLKTEALFRDRFTKLVSGLSSQTGTDAQLDVTRLVGSEIAAAIAIRVGTAVATRLGVSAGILGTGAALGPETLGVTLVAGLIVDAITGWIIGWFYKPEIEITNKLNRELDQLAALVVNGDKTTRGLKQELLALTVQRKELREAALRAMILPPLP